jgi:mannose-6-phosphate isomerase-like protein (cupin superfamily)
VVAIADVYGQRDQFFQLASPGKDDPNLAAASVVGRTSGTAEFRGCNLWQGPEGFQLVQLAEVAPGDRKYLHRHRHAETVWVILEGSGEFYSDLDSVVPIEAGMICHAYPGEWHGLGNTGDVPLRYLSVEGPFPRPSGVIEFAE